MWCTDPDPSDTTFVSDFAYLLRDSDGAIRVEHDRHIQGIFPKSVWIDALTSAGFDIITHTSRWETPVFSGTLSRRLDRIKLPTDPLSLRERVGVRVKTTTASDVRVPRPLAVPSRDLPPRRPIRRLP